VSPVLLTLLHGKGQHCYTDTHCHFNFCLSVKNMIFEWKGASLLHLSNQILPPLETPGHSNFSFPVKNSIFEWKSARPFLFHTRCVYNRRPGSINTDSVKDHYHLCDNSLLVGCCCMRYALPSYNAWCFTD
jgi:hypothetical protein